MLPPMRDFYEGITTPAIVALVTGAVLTTATFVVFFKNIGTLLRTVPKPFQAKSVYLCAVYQVI